MEIGQVILQTTLLALSYISTIFDCCLCSFHYGANHQKSNLIKTGQVILQGIQLDSATYPQSLAAVFVVVIKKQINKKVI